MARHAHRDSTSGQFAPVPPADTTVDDRSGDPVGERAEWADQTIYFTLHREQAGPLRRHRVLVHDATTDDVLGEVDPTVVRAVRPGALHRMAMRDAAGGDEFAQALTGGTPGGAPVDGPPRDPADPNVLAPASRGDGRPRT